jgi:CRISPR-associated protein Cmr1
LVSQHWVDGAKNQTERSQKMERPAPETDPPVIDPAKPRFKQDGRITQLRRYKLITPLFGGGVEPKKNDLGQLINGKSVRGQLRFWWRACRGTGSIEQMRLNEVDLWGAASEPGNPNPSKVSLAVSITERGSPDVPFLMLRNRPRPDDRNSIVPPYAAFSLQPTDEEIRQFQRRNETVRIESVQVGVEFSLSISFLIDAREEVEAALWCWETFGGIGGRTRRGFGAIALESVDEDGDDATPEKWKSREVLSKLNKKLEKTLAVGVWNPMVPHLPRSTTGVLKVTNAKYAGQRRTVAGGRNDVLKSWWYLIDKLHQFRQSPRNETVYRGRSDWPEPDEIRRKYTALTGNTTLRTPSHRVRTFPRVEFGLPIVFKFKDDDRGEPPKTTLEGAHTNRLASPLILRPLLCQDGAVCLAVILETPRVPDGGVELKGYGSVPTGLTLGDERDIPPLRGKTAKTDVLRAFLESL